MDTDNQTNESDTTSLAEQRRGTVLDSAADIAQREPQSSDNGTVPDSGADRAVAGEDAPRMRRRRMRPLTNAMTGMPSATVWTRSSRPFRRCLRVSGGTKSAAKSRQRVSGQCRVSGGALAMG